MATGVAQQVFLTQTLIRAGWPASEIPYALRIIQCESSGNPMAENSCCTGLFQIHETHGHSRAQLRDPLYNARVALDLWRESGWQPWECHTRPGGPDGNGSGGSAVGRALDNAGNLVDAVGGAGTGAIGELAGGIGGALADPTAAALAALGLDDLPRKALVIGTGLILLWFGGVLVALGAWRLTTGQTNPAQVIGAVGSAGTVAALA